MIADLPEWRVRSHFEKRAETYDKGAAWVKDEGVLGSVLALAKPDRNSRVLDLGCGTGQVATNLRAWDPSLQVFALDISPAMLAKLPDPAIRPVLSDAHSLPFSDSSFDVIVCRQALHYFSRPTQVMRECNRVLDSSGCLVIAQITPFCRADSTWWKVIARARQPLRIHRWTQNGIEACLKKSGFSIEDTVRRTTRESLSSWLERCTTDASKMIQIARLLREAPSRYRRLHNYTVLDGDVCFDSSWTIVSARPSRLDTPAN